MRGLALWKIIAIRPNSLRLGRRFPMRHWRMRRAAARTRVRPTSPCITARRYIFARDPSGHFGEMKKGRHALPAQKELFVIADTARPDSRPILATSNLEYGPRNERDSFCPQQGTRSRGSDQDSAQRVRRTRLFKGSPRSRSQGLALLVGRIRPFLTKPQTCIYP